jgi:pimeloyl-ACP methyl ester carboxylesterase
MNPSPHPTHHASQLYHQKWPPILIQRGMRIIAVCGVYMIFTSVSLSKPEKPKPAEPPVAAAEATLPEQVETFTIRTKSPANPELRFYLRTPKNYVPGKAHRLLFLGSFTGQDRLGCPESLFHSRIWLELADQQNWFLLSCIFHGEGGGQDRNLMFFYPETFSGKAVVEALDKVAKKYPVDPYRILMQGESAGAQFVHRFALWAPDRVTAVTVNSCSWFDKPTQTANQVAWLITAGDADSSSNQSYEMIDQLKAAGASPVCRSYMGEGHSNDAFQGISMAFLKCYDELTQKDLGKPRTASTPMGERLSMQGEKMPFVGDMQSWEYMPNTPKTQTLIPEESRIFLPSEDVAKQWGKPATE